MIILPVIREIFISGKTPEEICEALRSVTVARKEYRSAAVRPVFVGEVGDLEFKVMAVPDKPWIRNSFLPVIIGSIRTENGWSVVTIKMRMHLFVCVISGIWLGMVSLILLGTIVAAFVDGTPGPLCGVGLLLLFGEALIRIGFYIPAKRAMKRMGELFEVRRSIDA